jgi:hypothetical protein
LHAATVATSPHRVVANFMARIAQDVVCCRHSSNL